ncbi:MAG TPA: hypothetical protein VMB26_17875 [Candidatus Binataceae bacterium]|nr:hypothetical protein [Candidatus Binataceae bacterium]
MVDLLWLAVIGPSRLPSLIIRRKTLTCFFAIMLLAMWAVTRLEVIAGPQIRIVAARPEGGDEPHYLLMLLSIMYYHQLEMGRAYLRNPGGYYLPDRHTILVNRRTGQHALSFDHNRAFSIKSHDVYEVPAHPIAYPALLAILLAPFSPDMRYLVRDASIAMVFISWLVIIVVYKFVRTLGMGCWPALLAASVLGLASPWFAYTRSFYPEPAIGLAMVLALWALARDHSKMAALASAAAAFMKPPFALIGVGFVVERMWARRWREAASMVAVLAVCAIALVTFNYWLARTAVISGNLGLVPVRSLRPLHETLIGSRHGLLNFVPWTIVAFIFLVFSLMPWGTESSILRPIAIPTVLYLILLSLDSKGPGSSYGPRYWVPFLPWFAIASVEGLRVIRRPSPIRSALLLGYVPAVAFSAAIALPGALQYWALFDRPVSTTWRNFETAANAPAKIAAARPR